MDRIPPPNLVCPSGEPCHPLPIWGSICGITAGISVPHPLICWSEVDDLCFMTFIRKCVVTSKESITPAVCLPSAWLLGHPVCPMPPVRADPAQAGAEGCWHEGWRVGCRSWRLWQDVSISEMSPGEVRFWMKRCPFGGCWSGSLFSRKIFIEV